MLLLGVVLQGKDEGMEERAGEEHSGEACQSMADGTIMWWIPAKSLTTLKF